VRIYIVAQIAAPAPEGYFVSDLGNHWAACGHEVTLFTSSKPAAGSHVPDALRVVGPLPFEYRRSSFASRALSRGGFALSAALQVSLRALRESPPDLLLLVADPGCDLILRLADFPKPRFVIHWILDLGVEALAAFRVWPWRVHAFASLMHAIRRQRWSAADALVPISSGMASNITSRVRTAAVRPIPLWAPPEVERWRSPASRPSSSNDLVIAYQGNLGLAYDFRPLIEAAASSDSAGLQFVLAGRGAQRAFLEGEVRSRSLANVSLRWPVPNAELPGALSEADVHVMCLQPGLDGLLFPSKLVTSLAAGKPVAVIGEADTEIAALVREEACGVVIPRDPRALLQALHQLRSDRAALARMGAAARRCYDARFAFERAAASWDRLLDDLGSPPLTPAPSPS
jgi:glycosyltransferase involved in cell wall biosynthesis